MSEGRVGLQPGMGWAFDRKQSRGSAAVAVACLFPAWPADLADPRVLLGAQEVACSQCGRLLSPASLLPHLPCVQR